MNDNKKDLDFNNAVLKAFRVNRRLGFSKPLIGIFHCLFEGEGPGFLIELYDEYNEEASVCLYSVDEKDCQNINLLEIAKGLTREIMKRTGLDIKVIDEIQGIRMEYDEHDEEMWIAKMALEGIDDDY
jgi:hypothetical protein